MNINTIHNIDFLNNDLPDKCAKLIIADPPYYKVKGGFDFIWKTFDDYLKDVEKWAVECKRILADNGTLFWYGDDKNIAYAQIIFDKYFNLENSLIWYKYNLRGGMFGSTGGDNVMCFPICTERILMYSNGNDYHDSVRKAIKSVQDYLTTITTRNELAELLYKNGNCKNIASAKQNANNILTQKSAKPQLISKYQYDLIPDKNNKEYEELRKEYEQLRRPFNNNFNLNEVLQYNTNTNNEYEHDTVKPEKLTRALILTCSRENDLVVVPFAGSGTECAMAVKEKRTFIGYEITEKHAKMAQDRADKILKEPSLF